LLRADPAVLVEVLVVERADVRHHADLRIAGAARLDRRRRGRGDIADLTAEALADIDDAPTSRAGRQGQRDCYQGRDTRVPSLHPHWYSLFPKGLLLPGAGRTGSRTGHSVRRIARIILRRQSRPQEVFGTAG